MQPEFLKKCFGSGIVFLFSLSRCHHTNHPEGMNTIPRGGTHGNSCSFFHLFTPATHHLHISRSVVYLTSPVLPNGAMSNLFISSFHCVSWFHWPPDICHPLLLLLFSQSLEKTATCVASVIRPLFFPALLPGCLAPLDPFTSSDCSPVKDHKSPQHTGMSPLTFLHSAIVGFFCVLFTFTDILRSMILESLSGVARVHVHECWYCVYKKVWNHFGKHNKCGNKKENPQ